MTRPQTSSSRAASAGSPSTTPAATGSVYGGALAMAPRSNPGVLDTATWSPMEAWKQVLQGGKRWAAVRDTILHGTPSPVVGAMAIAPSGRLRQGDTVTALASLPDGQRALVRIGRRGDAAMDQASIGSFELTPDLVVMACPADAQALEALGRDHPEINSPRALGAIPRLGIGVRMTTAVWPGVFAAMDQVRCAANAIQNSVRELNLLDDLVQGRPAPSNYACGFGTIDSGYTGSTFEGLWLSGVCAACDHPQRLRYGADADHLQVKRDDVGLVRLRRTLSACRQYTFFTIDVSDILDYAAVAGSAPSAAGEALATVSREVLSCHREPIRIGGRQHALTEDAIRRFHAKHARALDALAEIAGEISRLREGRSFDLELSIDEHPPEIEAFDCLTSSDEFLFVLREITRRGIPVTHIAPNLGIEKGVDYRHPSGLAALGERTRRLHALADRFGVMIDIHSADDLGPAVRETLRRATQGRVHYKISPSLQILFAEVLSRHHPQLFQRWWDDAWAYAERSAAAGSALAIRALAAPRQGRLADDPVFHAYGFAFVGRRDASGAFLHRHEFYELSKGFSSAYTEAVHHRIAALAHEIFES